MWCYIGILWKLKQSHVTTGRLETELLLLLLLLLFVYLYLTNLHNIKNRLELKTV